MGKIIVVNRSWKRVEAFEYVDIMRGSVLGNPFKMKDESKEERKRVIQEFKQYLWKKMNEEPNKVSWEMMRLARMNTVDVKLVCCCKPLDCHGDVIKSGVEWLRQKNNLI